MTSEWKNRVDSPHVVLLFAVIAYGTFILVRLAVHAWDVSYFVTAGDAFTNPVDAPKGLTVLRGARGHDGQFYYRLALDPFTNHVTDYGITLDLPAYRQQRILYPVLANVLSFGNIDAVPVWMLAINYAGICAIAWVGANYARALGLHAASGLVFACYPGFVLTLARDFTEILAAALLLTTLWLARANRTGASAVFASLAVLARETTVLTAASFAGVSFWHSWKRRRLDRKGLFIAPIVVCAAWQVYLRLNWGYFPSRDTGTLGVPFVSFASSLLDKASFASGQTIAGFLQMLLVAGFAVAAGLAWRDSSAAPHEKFAWVLYAALACVVSGNVWSEDWSFLRNLWELYIFSAVILLRSASRAKRPLFACWGALWLFELVLRTDLHKAL